MKHGIIHKKPETPLLTADVVIRCPDGKLVMVKRKNDPYKDYWAFPGGFVEIGETVESAAVREALEETGLQVELGEIVGIYSDPDRDPRGHVVTVCYMAKYVLGELKASSDAKDVYRFTIDEIKDIKLAFDHNVILNDALQIMENKSEL